VRYKSLYAIENHIHIATAIGKIKELLPLFSFTIKEVNHHLNIFSCGSVALWKQLNATADNSQRRNGGLKNNTGKCQKQIQKGR